MPPDDLDDHALLGESTSIQLIAKIDEVLRHQLDRSGDQPCAGCEAATVATVLCDACRTALMPAQDLAVCREQLQSWAYRTLTPYDAPSASAGVCIVDPFGRPHVFPLSGASSGQLTIGRSPLADLSIFHPSVSYRHAVLLHADESHIWTMHDLGSRTGIGVRARPTTVPDGTSALRGTVIGRLGGSPARIQIGDFRFVFRYDRAERFNRYVELARHHASIEWAMGPTSSFSPVARLELALTMKELRLWDTSGGVERVDMSRRMDTLRFLELLARQPGFVDTKELLQQYGRSAWGPRHLYELVRRLRTLLAERGFVDLIESRAGGGGYRLALSEVSIIP